MTMDGRLLWSRDDTQVRHVASTIKMLNALVVLDHARLGDVVTVSRSALMSNGGVGLRAGQKLTVGQLLSIMLIHSANDAARALAIHVGGTQAGFVAMMNAKARALGLAHTHAVDPDGFSGRETSTARDLATLGQLVMAKPVLRQIVGNRFVSVPRVSGPPVTYASSDLLMGHYAGLEGIKTGFTSGAGFCYVAAARRGPVELLGVVLGTPSEAARFGQARRLLDWGFSHCHSQEVLRPGQSVTVKVDGRTIPAEATKPITVTVFDGAGVVTTRTVALTSARTGAVREGQPVARLVVYQGGTVLASAPLVADRSSATRVGALSRLGLLPALVGLAVLAMLTAAGGMMLVRRPPRGRPRNEITGRTALTDPSRRTSRRPGPDQPSDRQGRRR